jgi:cell division FtsZ-interacting protein ZapD
VDLRTAVQVFSTLVTAAGFVILLMIRNSQAQVKAELLATIGRSETKLEVHVAIDEERFKALGQQLDRIESAIRRSA